LTQQGRQFGFRLSPGTNLQVIDDSGPTDVSANAVDQNLQCQNNNPLPTSTYGSNTAKRNAQGQCAAIP
jgi:hypothetical protein